MKNLLAIFLLVSFGFTIEQPKWLYTPSLDGVVGAVGHAAPNEDKKLQKKIALIDARGKLSESLKIKIENETLKSSSSDGDNHFERKSTQTSDNLVRGAKVKEEFVDEDGSLYIWLVAK